MANRRSNQRTWVRGVAIVAIASLVLLAIAAALAGSAEAITPVLSVGS